MRCFVDMYGLSIRTAQLQQVEIDIPNPAKLADIITAIKDKLPLLEGDVILIGQNRLTPYYTFNINGCFYSYESELEKNSLIHLKDGQRIALLPLAFGG